ncbi:MAG: RDD family protein [Thermodesulfobacteriota bacterium]|nr:RDD family protein [Thermodesulfobacteriota bacterium]
MEEQKENSDFEYVGFWARVGAAIIDSVLVVVITWPVLFKIYGQKYLSAHNFISGPMDFVLTWVFPAIAIIVFWYYKSATPGKMSISAKIVDARTGGKPTTTQLIIRYLGYYISTIPLGLGIIWVAFDARKQGWHDKIAKTVVIRPKKQSSKDKKGIANQALMP